jgi:hypothetical protein
VYIDEELVQTIQLDSDFTTRSPEFYWNYELEKEPHTVKLIHLNPAPGKKVHISNFVVYSDEPFHPDF